MLLTIYSGKPVHIILRILRYSSFFKLRKCPKMGLQFNLIRAESCKESSTKGFQSCVSSKSVVAKELQGLCEITFNWTTVLTKNIFLNRWSF